METQPTFGLRDHLSHVIGAIAQAVCERPGEDVARQFARSQAAAATILTFQPTDAIEAMLAGHCVMFHELIVDSVHTALRGEDGKTRRATRANIVAMDRAFGANLTRIARHRDAEASPRTDAIPEAKSETDIGDRIERHQSVNRQLQPAEAAMAGLNRQARREFIRQARKRDKPGRAAVSPVRNEPAAPLTAPRTG